MSNAPVVQLGPDSPLRGLRKKREDHEHNEQALLIQWADAARQQHPGLELLFAIPNGGKRGKGVAARLQREGVKPGVPDLCLPVRRGHFAGLYIELKAPGGSVSADQRRWLMALRDEGYRAECVYGWEAARDLIIRYLKS